MKAELLIAYVLRYGVLLCLLVIGAGLAMKLGLEPSNGDLIHGLVNGHTAGDLHPARGDSVIALGLIMLIALPIIRVALTTVIFFIEEDWIFFAITLVVLSVLLSGILLGRAL
jgi:uncharacterized membrane protein